MQCRTCQHENPTGARFCQECGTALDAGCARCGTALPPSVKFCHECGAPQASPEPADGAAEPAPSAGPEAFFGGGRYEIHRLLGEGARKRVHLARDTLLDRDVALAVIKSEGLDEAGRARVRHEAQAMARLGGHPRVVTVHDTGEADGQLYIVSEFMGGGDVATRLAREEEGRLPVGEALRIASEVCEALEHAHARGVVHRDLKPGNIWLKEDGGTALGDFGLALSEDRTRITAEGMMVGTVAYMPPEQALGRPTDARSDLYALGVTLYEMLTGRTPFAGDDAVAIISQHINAPPVAPSWHNAEVGGPLDELVLKLLAKDPEQRPKSAADVGEALQAIASASVVAGVAQAAEGANPLDALASGVFVGREAEIATLRAAVDGAISGRGRTTLLVGEPGIGKTRTTEELGTYASMRGARVLWGRCYEGEGAPTYWPWVQIVRSYTKERDPAALLSEMGAGASAIADVVSEVRERIPGIQPAVSLEPEQARFRLFDSVTGFLRNAARQRPLVLVLDDLHWADKPSLLLLQFLARELAGARILVVGTYRDVELGRKHPLAETLAELARSESTERVLLRGLSEPDVARFVELSAGSQPSQSLVAAVFRETEGNPFFVHEVVRLLAAEGRLEHVEETGSWSVEIPQGIREAVGRRLNKLSDDCNELLAVASVIGRDFECPVLERTAELAPDRVSELLDEAVANRLVQEMPDSTERYRFSHALIRETLYDELGTTRRVRLHRRIGETLEAHHAHRIDARLASLAYHFAEGAHGGGDVDKAVGYARRAGDRAVGLSAYEDAAPHYERALQVLELKQAPDEVERCDLLLALGDARSKAGGIGPAKPVLEEAMALARRIPDARRLARGTASYAAASIELGLARGPVVALLEEALAALGDEDCIERVEVLRGLGLELALGDTHERARACAFEAVEAARRVGSIPALIEALFARNIVLFGEQDPAVRRAIVDEALALAEQTDDPELSIQAHHARFFHFFELGDFDACRREDQALEALLPRTQNALFIYYRKLHEAMWAINAGRLDEAEALAGEAFRYGQRIGGDLAVQMFGAQTAAIRYLQGRLDELSSMLGAVRHPQPAWRCAAAWAYACLGDEAETRRWFEPLAENDFAAVPRDANWLTALSFLAEPCVLLRDLESAAYLHEALLPYADRNVPAGAAAFSRGPGSFYLGRLAQALGRVDEAVGHYEHALAMTRRLELACYLPQATFELARVLLERDAPGDAGRALRLLNQSLDAARELGMPKSVEDALGLKLRAQGIDTSETHRSIYAVARSLEQGRPDLGPHTAPDGTVTLVFSDVEGFSQMTERLGDSAAHNLMQSHHAIVREETEAHGGHEVELRGDGFLLAFADPARAVGCCIEMQRRFAAFSQRHPEEPIRVRIGVHTGQAIRDADRFFGKTVIQAFRIADLARGGEILVSAELKERLEEGSDLRFDAGRDAELKGISGTHHLFAVRWGQPAA